MIRLQGTPVEVKLRLVTLDKAFVLCSSVRARLERVLQFCLARSADVGTHSKFLTLMLIAVLVGCCGAKVVCLDLFIL